MESGDASEMLGPVHRAHHRFIGPYTPQSQKSERCVQFVILFWFVVIYL